VTSCGTSKHIPPTPPTSPSFHRITQNALLACCSFSHTCLRSMSCFRRKHVTMSTELILVVTRTHRPRPGTFSRGRSRPRNQMKRIIGAIKKLDHGRRRRTGGRDRRTVAVRRTAVLHIVRRSIGTIGGLRNGSVCLRRRQLSRGAKLGRMLVSMLAVSGGWCTYETKFLNQFIVFS